MGLKLQSSGGGSVELNAPVTASGFTQTVPAANGNVVLEKTSGTTLGISAETGFFLSKQSIGASTTIPTGYSAMTAGPAYVSSGVTVTVASGSRWVVV